MLDGIEALIALEQLGTVSEAATRLRLTQSAVSKRIQALQNEVGYALIEPHGRRVQLTAQGVRFLERARPLLTELRNLTHLEPTLSVSHFSLAFADSIASSFGPEVVKNTLKKQKNLTFDFHAHRSMLVLESVQLGKYQIGLCTDSKKQNTQTDGLFSFPLIDEPMVLLHSYFQPKAGKAAPLYIIEESSDTWRGIAEDLETHHSLVLKARRVQIESFSGIVQMVKAGFGNGIIPLGVALSQKINQDAYRLLPKVQRQVKLVTRKNISLLQSFQLFHQELKKNTHEWFKGY